MVTTRGVEFGSLTVRVTRASVENFTYPGLHFLSVQKVSNTPFQKSHTQSAHSGTSAKKLTWHNSVLQTKASSRPLCTSIRAPDRSSEDELEPPHIFSVVTHH